MPPPVHLLSATTEVSSSCAIVGVLHAPRTGHVWPQPMMRVAVPTAGDEVGIDTGVWLTLVASRSSLTSALVWVTEPLTRATVPPLVRLLLPTRTELGVGQWPAVTTQLALISDAVQPLE